jgi:hypothetical protein
MAKVKTEIKVSSVSANGEWAGRVIQGWETYNADYKGTRYTKKRQWTAFFELPTNINKDDVIEITGELQTKTDGVPNEFEGKTYFKIEHIIADAKFTLISAAVPIPPSAHDAWNNPTPDSGQSPF